MRGLTRGFVSILVIVLLVTVGGNVGSVKAAATFPSPVNYLRLFAQTNGGGDAQQVYSRNEAVALARRFDVIVGLRWTFADHVQAMHAANPRLRVLVYMNGAMSRPEDRATMPEPWFLHDGSGSRIRNLHFDLQYMDVGNAGWRDFTTRRCADWIRLSGFDGCFLDDLGAGNIGTNLSAWPIDPRTGQPITKADWITQASGEVGIVQSGNPNKLVTSNGLNNGANYFGSTGSARLLDTSIASAAEGWLRGSRDAATQFRSVAAWKQDVDMLLDAGRRGRSTLLGTKLWTTSTAAQQSQWRAYTYASFLLGTDGYQFLNFNLGGTGHPDASTTLESVNLGSPTETYALRGGVYQRRYTGGLAAVNPGTSPVTVNLGQSYVTPSGQVVSTVTMAAHTGVILTNAAA